MPRLVDRAQERSEVVHAAGGRQHLLRALGRRLAVRSEQPGSDEQSGEQVVMGGETGRQEPHPGELADGPAEVRRESGALAQLQVMDDELAIDQPATLQLGVERPGRALVGSDFSAHLENVGTEFVRIALLPQHIVDNGLQRRLGVGWAPMFRTPT